MEDDLDLRLLLRPLVNRWPIVLGLGLIAAVVMAAVKMSAAPTYEAVALVSVAPPRYSLQLQGVVSGSPIPTSVYPELALSGSVLGEVLSSARDQLPKDVDTLSELRRVLEAEPASDATLVRLRVRHDNPEGAAGLANAWANIFAARAGQLSGQDLANLEAYQTQLAQAKEAMDAADTALATFQANNPTGILAARLESQQIILVERLNQRHNVALLIGELQDLLERLAVLGVAAPAQPAEDLALLSLMTRVYGSGTSVPIENNETMVMPSAPVLQIQINTGTPLAGPTVADQRALAESLLATLSARAETVEQQIAALEPEILRLQGEFSQAELDQAQMVRNHDLAVEHHRALAGRIEEAKIAANESANIAQVASPASVPTERMARGTVVSAAAAGLLGLALGAAVAWVEDYWRRGQLVAARPPAPDPAGAGQ